MDSKFANFLNSDYGIQLFNDFYGKSAKTFQEQKERYEKIIQIFSKNFNHTNYSLFSTPGRIEIGGNHTDHNHGKVIAAGISLDSVAAAAPLDIMEIELYSNFYDRCFRIGFKDLKPDPKDHGTIALMKGMVHGFIKGGYKVGGFQAYIDSRVLSGSGLSSSASFEVLLGTILSGFYNEQKVDPIEIAKIGKYAENIFMYKPCGLMDQIACALCGIINIDFKNPQDPIINKMDVDFAANEYAILVVDTGLDHENLTSAYASIPDEMKKVAAFFNKNVLREVDYVDLLADIPKLRGQVGDRAILRAIHFFEENNRVDKQMEALKKKDYSSFLKTVNESGDSSWKILQNCFIPERTEEQGIVLALTVSNLFINKIKKGSCRVHGGGFAGTILTILPDHYVREYIQIMEDIFGKGSVTSLNIRQSRTAMLY